MFGLGKKDTHKRLMGRMAATVGADLQEAALRGDLPPEEEAEALERCCGCTNVGTCEDWLEEHVDGADAPPRFCANQRLMTELRQEAAE